MIISHVKNYMNIGLFDSGIGGLTVLKEIVKLTPHNRFIYLADTANLPYGNKTREQLLSYANAKMNWMRKMQVDIVAIACNTTDSVILSEKSFHSDMNIVNIIQPTAHAILKSYSEIHRVGVLATEATAKNLGYENAFKSSNVQVMTVPCPELVPWIESGMHDYELGYKLMLEYMNNLFNFDIDCLIYGCTHYKFADNVIKDVMMKYKPVQIFNPAIFVAKEVMKQVIADKPVKIEFEFYITNMSSKNRLEKAVIELFGFKPKVKLVNLST